MTLSMAFWIIVLVAVVFGGAWVARPSEVRWGYGAWFVLFVLILLLGVKTFGWPIQG